MNDYDELEDTDEETWADDYYGYQDDEDPDEGDWAYADPPVLVPFTLTERFIRWWRRLRFDFTLWRRDPGCTFRRCVTCGKPGCVPGEVTCHEHWIPF